MNQNDSGYRIVPGPETDAAIKAFQDNPGTPTILTEATKVFVVVGYDAVYGVFTTEEKAKAFLPSVKWDDAGVIQCWLDGPLIDAPAPIRCS